jgi:hypothetical protein
VGDNRKRLPPMRCLWWKTMAEEVPWAGFASQRYGQALGARGAWRRGAPFGPVRQHGGGLSATGDSGRSGGQCEAEQRGAQSNGGRGKAEWAATSSVTSGVVVRGASHVGRRRLAANGAERSTRGEHDYRQQGWRAGPGDRPGRSNGNGPLTCGLGPVKKF